jgi:hypothetical protein
MTFTRREAVLQLATMLGASVVAPRLAAASFDLTQTGSFSATDISLLDEIGDTILPPSDVPGAKAVGIGPFLAMMITDCYTPEEQAVLRDGLKQLETGFTQRFGGTFVTASAADRTTYLNDLDREQLEYHRTLSPGALPHYFRVLKELTILGYFSSEVGASQALRYSEVPGGYDGNAPYRRGERAWFN